MISAERRAHEQYASDMCNCGNPKSTSSYLCRDHYFDLPDDLRRKLYTMTLVDAFDAINDELGLRWPAEGEVL